MGKRYRSERNFFGGGYTTYDSHGKKVSRTEPNFFGGGYTTYDAHGKKIGRSEPNFFGGGYTHYDAHGHKTGRSDPKFFGGFTNYDRRGHKTGYSDPKFFGGFTTHDTRPPQPGAPRPSKGGGCYIATCVYGSYEAPEVLTLRRFRDEVLAKHLPGRAFIRCYYAVSPHLVRRFGGKKWFRTFWKNRLDRMVERLKQA